MCFLKDKKKRKLFIILSSIFVVLIALFIACAIYLGTYYHADHSSITAFLPQDYSWDKEQDDTIAFYPKDNNPSAGLIFYPGGKVEHTSYIPLMHALSEQGFLCVLVKMPFNLAVFDINAADGIKEEYPDVATWYIGGHSLGGSMAAYYIDSHPDDFKGLLLLGSYSSKDLSSLDIGVLSIYGSEDLVLNKRKYKEALSKLPAGFDEIIIEGGCHAYFGMYGQQDGDGNPTISNKDQILKTAQLVGQWAGTAEN